MDTVVGLVLLGILVWIIGDIAYRVVRWVRRLLHERRLLEQREEWYASLQRGEHRDSFEEWRRNRVVG